MPSYEIAHPLSRNGFIITHKTAFVKSFFQIIAKNPIFVTKGIQRYIKYIRTAKKFCSALDKRRGLCYNHVCYIIRVIQRTIQITARKGTKKMAPKNKFTREEMIRAALDTVRKNGMDKLTAKTLAEALGTSTQPIFTCFGSMDAVKKEVHAAAQNLFEAYLTEGMCEYIPFYGYGMQYIRFAREEPLLYRLLFLSNNAEENRECIDIMLHIRALILPSLVRIHRITEQEARRFFRDVWLVAHSLSVLIVTGGCPYNDAEIGKILTGSSASVMKAIKEIPGYTENTFDQDEVFRALIEGKANKKAEEKA